MVTLLKERDTALGFSQLSPNAAVLAKADCFAKCFFYWKRCGNWNSGTGGS